MQSSYKGDDSSLSIDGCFEQIQDALENNLERSDISYRNKQNTSANQNDHFQKKHADIDPQVLQIIEESNQRVDFAHQMILENNNEVERIVSQLQNAQKKIAKYKACVSDLKSKLQRTAKALGDKNRLLNEKQRRIEILAKQVTALNEEKSSNSSVKGDEKETQTSAISGQEIGIQVDTKE